MRTFEQTPIWDGKCIFPKSATDPLISAFINFVHGMTENPDGHIGILWTSSPEVKDIFAMAPLTTFDGDRNPGCLREFMAISGQKLMKRTTVAEELASFKLPAGKHDTWFTLTFKLDDRIIKKVPETLERLAEDLKALVPEGEFTVVFIIQPLPASFAKHSAARGGNLLGLDHVQEDSVLFLSMLKSETPELAQRALPLYKSAVEDIETYSKSVDGNVDFRYLNYCHSSQDPLATYGEESITKMREAAAKYDPSGVFQTRVPGGFKLPKIKQ
ncbi:putative fad binding domain-containing protein [Eutypa lata UCREL1]|uniref:Putative fad binding domain-containing protein n=1 Tax=Eutypa lata (strain UCR-EL1) TaxID=1287681 RepID=M7T7E4_EUTLA|nr:putative fad binding domain-containing protein [Eutypa lata UCREL1]